MLARRLCRWLSDGLCKRLRLRLSDGLCKSRGGRCSWLPDGLGKSRRGWLSNGLPGRYGALPNDAVRVGLRIGKGIVNNSIGLIGELSKRVGFELSQGESRKLIDAHGEIPICIIVMILDPLIILDENSSSVAILLIRQAKLAAILIEPDIEEGFY